MSIQTERRQSYVEPKIEEHKDWTRDKRPLLIDLPIQGELEGKKGQFVLRWDEENSINTLHPSIKSLISYVLILMSHL